MNKMKKLLSVLLAVILVLSSFTVVASATKTSYKTVDELTALDAYSPYGEVTRLTTEERMSIVFDALESILGPANINMGEVVNLLGIKIVIDLRNIDGICDTLDSFKSSMNGLMWGLASGILNLGILEELNFDNWTSGMSRDETEQLVIVRALLTVLKDNAGVISNIIKTGKIELGFVGGLIGGLDLSSIEKLLGDLPGLIKGMVFGLFERWDDTTDEILALEAAKVGNGGVIDTVNNFVKNLFTNDMSISTVKADANGNIDTTKHQLPSGTAGYRVRYNQSTVGSDKILTATQYATQKYVDAQLKADPNSTIKVGDYYIAGKYILQQEVGTTDYVWAKLEIDEDGNIVYEEDENGKPTTTPKRVGENLKYYEIDSPLLPSLTAEIDLKTMSAADLLYTFVSPVFGDMAPVVLNGSMKKILGGLFGAKYIYVGEVGSDEVNALDDASNKFFTEEQGDYLWEWSNYTVIDGKHYYRYQDQIFKSDLSNTNRYFDIINWDYKIETTFMDEFIPENGGSTSDTLFMHLNDFLIKIAKTILSDATYAKLNLTAGSNSNLVGNIKNVAQTILAVEPEAIFGSDYATNPKCYYNLLMSSDNATVLTGIGATAIDLLMPQMLLPSAADLMAQNTTIGALLAGALRELATQLVPQNNYDALIYADYNTKKFIDPVAKNLVISGETANSYWLDVILTIGIDIGIEYLHNFVDFYGDTAAISANNTAYHSDYTYEANTTQATLQAYWENMVYYIVNWILADGSAGTQLFFSGSKIVNYTDSTDPWVILGSIFANLLPINQILNIDTSDSLWLEKTLRNDFILSLVDLKWENITNLLIVPDGYLRNDHVLNQLATLLKNLVNGLFAKVGGGSYALIPAAITNFDELANQNNLATLVNDLLATLGTAQDNGLLVFALPLVNYILGWKTSSQTIADPQIWTEFRDGNDYAYQWSGEDGTYADNGKAYPNISNTHIKFLNNSSGMLETHRGSSVVDHEYAIQVGTITSDANTNTLNFTFGDGNGYVSPYETLDIAVGGTYAGDEVITVTIPYQYIGKDGNAVGGQLYKSITFFMSNLYEDANVDGRFDGDDDKDYAGIQQYKKYQFTEDIYGSVTSFYPEIFQVKATASDPSLNWQSTSAPDGKEVDSCTGAVTNPGIDMTGNAATYFEYYQGQEGGWPSTIAKSGGKGNGYLYKAKSGVTADTEFPYGIYDMGQVAVKYKSTALAASGDSKVWNIDYIYYTDYDVYDVYTDHAGRNLTIYDINQNDSNAVAAFNEYMAAYKDIVKYATYPMMTTANGSAESVDYVASIMPKIPAAITRIEAAAEALEEYLADAQASAGSDSAAPSYIQDLEAQLALDDNDGEKEVNFQDYRLYEYFNYADIRTEARNLVKTYYAPEVMDQYYILNSGIREAELDEVIADESNAYIQAGITASRIENDEAAIAASIEARDAWTMPIHTELFIDDMTARLVYYKSFLDGSRVVAANKESTDKALAFLNKEIAYAAAQNYVEADYTVDTWEVYADALERANKVVAGTEEYANFNSTVFDAKFQLMKAQKQLLKKADSLILAGGTDELNKLIAQANTIFANMGTYYAAIDADEADAAYAALIQALGYNYQAVYCENDAEVKNGTKAVGDLKFNKDGSAMMFNLYADSALEYSENDRPNRQSNQAKVNAAAKALQDAINLFECTIKLVEKDGGAATVEQEVKYINGITPGSIATVADLLNHVQANNANAQLETFVSKASAMGTGAGVNVNVDGIGTLAIYLVVIYGDVNGDGAIDAFDAIEVDVKEAKEFTGAYSSAADTNGDGMIDSTDYAAIKAAATTAAALAQTMA